MQAKCYEAKVLKEIINFKMHGWGTLVGILKTNINATSNLNHYEPPVYLVSFSHKNSHNCRKVIQTTPNDSGSLDMVSLCSPLRSGFIQHLFNETFMSQRDGPMCVNRRLMCANLIHFQLANEPAACIETSNGQSPCGDKATASRQISQLTALNADFILCNLSLKVHRIQFLVVRFIALSNAFVLLRSVDCSVDLHKKKPS